MGLLSALGLSGEDIDKEVIEPILKKYTKKAKRVAMIGIPATIMTSMTLYQSYNRNYGHPVVLATMFGYGAAFGAYKMNQYHIELDRIEEEQERREAKKSRWSYYLGLGWFDEEQDAEDEEEERLKAEAATDEHEDNGSYSGYFSGLFWGKDATTEKQKVAAESEKPQEDKQLEETKSSSWFGWGAEEPSLDESSKVEAAPETKESTEEEQESWLPSFWDKESSTEEKADEPEDVSDEVQNDEVPEYKEQEQKPAITKTVAGPKARCCSVS